MAPRRRLVTVAATGNRLETLQLLRQKVAAAVDAPDLHPRDLAALANRLRDLVAEIEELSPTKEVSAVDDLSTRRRTRRGAASG